MTVEDSRAVAIIGMPGSGKTTVGRELAAITGRRFFDTDRMVKAKTGKSAARIINESGEAYFRALETECLEAAVKEPFSVISTGGGIVVVKENRALLKDNCFVIYITRPLDALYTHNRPLSLQMGVDRLYAQRHALYEELSNATLENLRSKETARIITNKWLNG